MHIVDPADRPTSKTFAFRDAFVRCESRERTSIEWTGTLTFQADMQAQTMGGTSVQPSVHDAPKHGVFIPALESSSVAIINAKSQPESDSSGCTNVDDHANR